LEREGDDDDWIESRESRDSTHTGIASKIWMGMGGAGMRDGVKVPQKSKIKLINSKFSGSGIYILSFRTRSVNEQQKYQ
jgi:hypothetical protein